jgi:hypothetical protein
MRQPGCRRDRPSLFGRLVRIVLRRKPFPDRLNWDDPPPATGVREPRGPRPSVSGGTAVLELPTDLG